MKLWLLVLYSFVYFSSLCQPVNETGKISEADSTYVYRSASSGGIGKFYHGREIAGIMDASGADWLERSGRPAEENTELAIENMQLSPNSVVADIGAGSGYYTFRIASRVPQGKVYAVEIQEELISMLNEKITASKIPNVEVVRGDTLGVNLPDSSIDVAIMVDVYHELSWPREIIQSVGKSLRANGKLILMEYRGEDPNVRIKPLHKTTVAQLKREMLSNGFELERQVDALPIQHFLVFRRRGER